MDMLFAAQKYF